MYKEEKKSKSFLLPLGLTLAGLGVALTVAYFVMKATEETEHEQDVENYDVKNAPFI